MHANAQAPAGAASLQSALGQHQDGLVDGGVDASRVDTADGKTIVGHVFGGQQDQVAAQLAGTAELGGILGGGTPASIPGTREVWVRGSCPDFRASRGSAHCSPVKPSTWTCPGGRPHARHRITVAAWAASSGASSGRSRHIPGRRRPLAPASRTCICRRLVRQENYGWTGWRWWAGRRRYSHTSPRTGSSSGMNA